MDDSGSKGGKAGAERLERLRMAVGSMRRPALLLGAVAEGGAAGLFGKINLPASTGSAGVSISFPALRAA